MKVVLTHQLPEKQAVQCAKQILENLRHAHANSISNVVEVWSDKKAEFSFRYRNLSVTGTISVSATQVELEGRLPLAAMLFSGIIEDTIRKEAKQLIEKCKTEL